jgi:hypothetical protein
MCLGLEFGQTLHGHPCLDLLQYQQFYLAHTVPWNPTERSERDQQVAETSFPFGNLAGQVFQ